MAKDPHCRSAEDVGEASRAAAEQIERMARSGLALPAMHVEYIRQAVDSAGSELLAHPPMSSPWERLQWTEAAVETQLAPLPRLSNALSSIARGLGAHQVEELVRAPAPDIDAQRLLAAVVWVVDPTCSSEASWEQSCQLLLTDGSGEAFTERLVAWDPLKSAVSWRLARARELLLVIWGWVANGCGGVAALATLFSWTSLVVTMAPLAEQAQRLQPVNVVVNNGISRVQRAPPEKKQDASAKAWTNVLFVIDSPEKSQEDWWWLKLIRTMEVMDPPWPTDEGPDSDAEAIRQPGPASWRRGNTKPAEKHHKEADDSSPMIAGDDSPFGFDPHERDDFDPFGAGHFGGPSDGSLPSFSFSDGNDRNQVPSVTSRAGSVTPVAFAEVREEGELEEANNA